MASRQLWDRYRSQLISDASLGFLLDVSRMDLDDTFLAGMKASAARALKDMDALEKGAVANPDEGRMVGHYWIRTPSFSPSPEIRTAIEQALHHIRAFTADVHQGRVAPPSGGRFENVLIVGIGGSALGPQFVADALGSSADRLHPFFLDNTDPDGMDRVFEMLGSSLANTLTVVISKSGGTKETRNGMLEAARRYTQAGLDFPRHAVAVTGDGSELDKVALAQKWLDRFPMWDWVGGRTSELAAVGLLPAALQGIDIDSMLSGARHMDALTRVQDVAANPAMMLALAWHKATGGKAQKDMVVLPYKDRLLLLSRYLQQLVMESLGKEKDLDGNTVHQGLAVYGNKGSTDQHAYVQQLRDGVPNFFAAFIEVLKDRSGSAFEVEPGVTSGDFLFGFLQGTRRALYEGGRMSLTITIDAVTPQTVGALIALFERAVGFYASLVHINAYHQPGVEAGKKAAQAVITLQHKVVESLKGKRGVTAEEAAQLCGQPDDVETVFKILEHLAANSRLVRREPGRTPVDARYFAL